MATPFHFQPLPIPSQSPPPSGNDSLWPTTQQQQPQAASTPSTQPPSTTPAAPPSSAAPFAAPLSAAPSVAPLFPAPSAAPLSAVPSAAPMIPAPHAAGPGSSQALMDALNLLQQNIGALQSLIPLMSQQPPISTTPDQLQQQQAAASVGVASVISQLAVAAANILPQAGLSPPINPAFARCGGFAPSPLLAPENAGPSNPYSGSAFVGTNQPMMQQQPQQPQLQSQSQEPKQQQQPQQQQQPPQQQQQQPVLNEPWRSAAPIQQCAVTAPEPKLFGKPLLPQKRNIDEVAWDAAGADDGPPHAAKRIIPAGTSKVPGAVNECAFIADAGLDEENDEESPLLEGTFDIIEVDPVELLAEHTHFCEICGKGFKRDANLRMHMRGHGDAYKTPEALARPGKQSPEGAGQLPKRFSCPFVGCKRNQQHRAFVPLKTMLCVKNHYRRTHCPKMLSCSKCGAKRFSVVADLKTHEKHCGRDRWLCSCGTSFSRKDKLLGHLALFKGHHAATAVTTAAAPPTVADAIAAEAADAALLEGTDTFFPNYTGAAPLPRSFPSSVLALAASNILPQMGMAPPVLPPQVGMAPPAAAPQIGMAPAPAVPAGTSTGYNPVSSAANPASQLLVLPQNAVPQHQHQHQHQQQQQQQQQQQETSTPVNRQKQLISSLGASGSLLQQQAAQLTLATQSPPYDESPRQQSVIKLVPPAPQESDDLAAKLQLSQPGFAPTMAAPQQAKAAVPPRPAPPQAQTAQTQAPALARQFPKQGAVDRLLGGAILLTQKRKLGSDGGTAIVASGATAIPGNGGFPGSDLARKRSKENVGEDIGGKQRGSPEGDDDDAALPEGSYDVIEMDPVELLAEHTHFCEICGKGFKRDANLRMHMRGHGDEYKTPEALARPDKHLASVPQRPKRFSCPFVGCKRNSQHQRFLPLKTMLCVKNHYRRTHCPKMLACSKCGAKRFSVVADLKTHEKHCGRDRWLCSCGTSFSRKDKLLGHLALFKGHRPANPSLTAADDAPAGAINDGARVEAPAIAGPSVPAPPQAMEREREVVVYQESPAQLTLGFISIDCGYQGRPYPSPLGFTWQPDPPTVPGTPAVITGISPDAGNERLTTELSLRAFNNDRDVNCYHVPLTAAGRYLVRLTFWYKNYDGKNSPPVFNVTVGPGSAGQVDLRSMGDTLYTLESIATVRDAAMPICLQRVGDAPPIINAIEIRPLPPLSYSYQQLKADVLLVWWRFACGDSPTRDETFSYQQLKADVLLVWWRFAYGDSPARDQTFRAGQAAIPFAVTPENRVNIRLRVKTTAKSRIRPVTLSGLEIVQLFEEAPAVGGRDVAALGCVKTQFGEPAAMEEWVGDPCYPVTWPGVQCSFSANATNVIGLDLNHAGLSGSIPACIANLSSLSSLVLNDNGLTGDIPSWLGSLSNLHSLKLGDNLLAGSVPAALAQLPEFLHLDLSNNNLSGPFPFPPTVSIDINRCGDVCPVALAEDAAGQAGGRGLFRGGSHVRRFSLAQLAAATANFHPSHIIGSGGFGPVFKGILPDGRMVAAKKRDEDSLQGEKEFYNEVDLLSRARHPNLVDLIGFCRESGQQVLVYEFMPHGTVRDHLYDSIGNPLGHLRWLQRLHIALNAARGIEYLHTGLTPPIIHRDIKTSNILLDANLRAHVADFGLSREGSMSRTHVSTNVKGTAGYLDPEYYTVQQLTDRSDVFSFGVVLLELISGRQPIDLNRPRDDWSIIDWVRSRLQQGQIEAIIDPTLSPSEFDIEVMWRVAEVGVVCVEPKSFNRPSISDVCFELNHAIQLEAAAGHPPPGLGHSNITSGMGSGSGGVGGGNGSSNAAVPVSYQPGGMEGGLGSASAAGGIAATGANGNAPMLPPPAFNTAAAPAGSRSYTRFRSAFHSSKITSSSIV
ncbi:unnamed protein product [Closterium sp. Yama58-4]|nr:unnamed protein product [Closterium sp. Yama58-4]